MKARIEKLQEQAVTPERESIVRETSIGRVTLEENREMNRVQIHFPAKPSEEIRTALKLSGFHWAQSEGAWQRQLSDSAWHRAKTIIEKLPEEGTRAEVEAQKKVCVEEYGNDPDFIRIIDEKGIAHYE